jgi:hypothetical protein
MRELNVFLIGTSVVLCLCVGLLPGKALGDSKRIFMEYNYQTFDGETKNKRTGVTTENDFTNLTQLYTVDLIKNIYPYLSARGGAIFEFVEASSTRADVDFDRRERTTEPFAELDLENPLYSAGVGYRKKEIKEKATAFPTTRDFRERVETNLGWRPVDLPHFDVRFTRTDFYDNLDTVDLTEDLIALNSRYTGVQDLFLDYTYTRDDTENRISNLESLQETHNGRVNYSRSLIEGTLNMDTSLVLTRSTGEISARRAPGGSELSSLLRSNGLFSLDNTPEDGPALTSTPALIDGNMEASAGIDIGLDGDETILTNVGLDFGIPLTVDTLFVWVDRRLSSTVAPSFTWSIYTSPDNTDTSTWTLHATVVSAPFGIFEDRFEIVFPAIETQFIKVVTRPLSPAVPDASNFPNIFITELEAFTTLRVRPGETLRTENERLSYNLNLLGTVSDQTGVGYNLFYRFDESDPGSQRRTSLTNGVYVNHIFNDVLSGSARLFRDDRDETGEKRSVEHSYNTSLRAAYLEHLVHTLSYTGTRLDDRDGASYTNSVFLRNAARLYKGWDAFLDTGFSWDKDGSGNRARSTIARVGTNLLPHEKLNVAGSARRGTPRPFSLPSGRYRFLDE